MVVGPIATFSPKVGRQAIAGPDSLVKVKALLRRDQVGCENSLCAAS